MFINMICTAGEIPIVNNLVGFYTLFFKVNGFALRQM